MDQPTTNPSPPQPPTTPSQKTDFLSGIQTAIDELKLRPIISKVIFIGLTLQGLWGLLVQIRLIFFIYPKLPDYYAATNFDPSVYQKVAIETFFLSINGLIDAIYGTAMLFKPTHLVKNIHLAIAIILFAFSTYLSFRQSVLNPQEILNTIEQASLLFKTLTP